MTPSPASAAARLGADEHRAGARGAARRTSRRSASRRSGSSRRRAIVSPERTPSGYRKFSHADVERLRYVLRAAARPRAAAQADRGDPRRHRPRTRAAAAGRRSTPTVPEVALSADGLPSPESFRRSDDLRLSRKEVAQGRRDLRGAPGASSRTFGLVTPAKGTGHYDTDALVVCTTARELGEFGIEPRHLRAFKAAADREVGLVEQVVAPQRRATDAAARARTEDTVSADRGAVAQAARHLGQGRPQAALTAAWTRRRRLKACAKSTSWESGSRCPRTSRSCCSAR